MAIKTGSTYFSDSDRDIVKILGLTSNSTEVSASDCDNDEHPEISARLQD